AEFHCSKLNEIKVEVQADAAKNALMRAKKIAEATGSSIGDIRSGTMGVLQITPKYSNQVDDAGINDLSSIEKEITAVVSASFEIK
ncbi:MAG: SIMPL domain-containing protein, partial [Bacteroidota bacterium]|nr:SIMPL domain-containing protein [Bacteroidota bacterium]